MIDDVLPLMQHMAAADGKYRMVECLVKLKADCNIKDRWGRTPMAIAIHSKEQVRSIVRSSMVKSIECLLTFTQLLCSSSSQCSRQPRPSST